MLEIWGRPYSSSVIPVIWTTAELKLEYKLKLAGGSFGQLDTPEFAQMNPNRMIPTIRDGDFCLWESHVIVRYLCAKYGLGTFCPADVQQRAVADQWMEWSGTRAFTPVIQMFFGTVRTASEKRDMAIVKAYTEDAVSALSVLDAHLSTKNYVAGDVFAMADIPLGAMAYRYFNVDVTKPILPHVEAWYERLTQRPACQAHVMRFFGTNPDGVAGVRKSVCK